MFVLITRGSVLIGVPPPRFHESDSVGPDVRRAGRRGAAEPGLGLDREEAAGVVLEIVGAEDDDLVLVRRSPDLAERSRAGGLLGRDVIEPVLDPGAPRLGALDRRAQPVARSMERGKLLFGAEHGDGDRPVGVRAEIVVVEVDAVAVGVQLQPDRRCLVRQRDLDEAAALVGIDASAVLVGRCGAAGGCQSEDRESEQRSPEPLENHRELTSLPGTDDPGPGETD